MENAQSFAELQRRNASVVALMRKVTAARKRRFDLQERLAREEEGGRQLQRDLDRQEKLV